MTGAGDRPLVLDKFLSDESCLYLCDVFKMCEHRLLSAAWVDPFWRDRFVYYESIIETLPDAGPVMLSALRRATTEIRHRFRVADPMYADMLQITCWREGVSMAPHADNTHSGLGHRELSAVIYLNESYEGGLLYFTRLGITVKPRRGMLVAMRAGPEHEHGVSLVERGTRLTMPFFLTSQRPHAARYCLAA